MVVTSPKNATEELDGFHPKRQPDLHTDVKADGIVLSAASQRRSSRTITPIDALGHFKHRNSQIKSVTTTPQVGQGSSATSAKAAASKITHSGASANWSFAKTMDISAKKITAAVHSLYKGSKDGDDRPGKRNAQRPSVLGAVDGKRLSRIGLRSDDDDLRSASSDSSGSDSDAKERKSKQQVLEEEEDEDFQSEDEYDFKQAASKVTTLLDSLNCDHRLDIMSELNSIYVARRGAVEEDLRDLGALEDDFQEREEQAKTSMQSMLTTFEDKQMREVKVLVKCNKTLHLGAIGKLKKRQRFAKQGSMLSTKSTISRKSRSSQSPKSKTSPIASARDKITERESDRSKPHVDVLNIIGLSSKEDYEYCSDDGGDPDEEAAEEDNVTQANDAKASEEKPHLDGLDVEAAKRKLKEMQDIPSRVLMLVNQGAPPAADILQALAQVQEGQVQLEQQVELAKKALAISKAANEHLIEGSENPSNAVLELIEEIRVGIFGENGEQLIAGPDPDELEEECKMLEALIAKQDEEIDILNKQRERTNILEQELNEAGADDAKSDASEEKAPALLKSELRDGRIEAAQSSKLGRSTAGRLNREKTSDTEVSTESASQTPRGLFNNATNEQIIKELGKDPEQPGSAISTLPSWQSNRQIQLLQSRIQENETKIARAQEVHKRMKKEYAMLKYCAKMSDAGLDAILETFNPDEAGGDESESDWESSDDEKKSDNHNRKALRMATTGGEAVAASDVSDHRSKTSKLDNANDGSIKRRASAGIAEASTSVSGKDEPRSPISPKSMKRQKSLKKSPTMLSPDEGSKRAAPKRSLTAPLSQSPKQSSQSESVQEQEEQPVRSKRGRIDLKDFQGQVSQFNQSKLQEAETEMQTRIKELQEEIANDTKSIKAEKKKQTGLKKELKKLKKNFANMSRQNSGIPTSIDTLDKQVAAFAEGETKLQEQIDDLRHELAKQQRLLERAKAESSENEERRRQSQTASSTRVSQTQLLPQQRQTQNLQVVSEHPASRTSTLSISSTMEVAEVSPPSIRCSNASVISAAQGNTVNVANNGSEGAVVGSETTESPVKVTIRAPSLQTKLDDVMQPPNPERTASESHQDGSNQTQQPAAFTPADSRVSTLGNKSAGPPARIAAAAAGSRQTDISAVSHEDLNELVRLQSRNEELKSEIDDMMKKMKQLRNAMKKGRGAGLDREFIHSIVGGATEHADAKPPPEYLALKKELRLKQNEVRALRKRWVEDHKDLDMIAEKVKHNLQYEAMAQEESHRSEETPIQTETAARANAEKTELIDHMTASLLRSTTSEFHRTNTSDLRSIVKSETEELQGSSSQTKLSSDMSFEVHPARSVSGRPRFQRAATTHGFEALMAPPTAAEGTLAKDARARASTWTRSEDGDAEHVRRKSDVFARFQGVRKSLALHHHTLSELVEDDDVDVHDRTQPVYKRTETQDSFSHKPELGAPSRKAPSIKRSETHDGFLRT